MIAPKVLNWASQLDELTREQAARTAALPFVVGHVALMADAHFGKGSTVGSVIPTRAAIIPAAVGVDIGCGMVAAETVLTAADLPDDLGDLLRRIERGVPAGVGQGHEHAEVGAAWLTGHPSAAPLDARAARRTQEQFGTLGSGNHFLELCLDERERAWVLLHSGSRGIGNALAQRHIEAAKGVMARYFVTLADPDLAYLAEGTPEFDAYLADLQWAQTYAAASRARMAEVALGQLAAVTGREPGALTHGCLLVNCHHNYTARERHHGHDLWLTRKGAIAAHRGELGVVPGSMGTRSYVVRGLGNPASFASSAHGAGRAMSRSAARRQYSAADLETAMRGRTWLSAKAAELVDEIPAAYKDVDRVMADQSDLVEVVHTLTAVLNYKGT